MGSLLYVELGDGLETYIGGTWKTPLQLFCMSVFQMPRTSDSIYFYLWHMHHSLFIHDLLLFCSALGYIRCQGMYVTYTN